MIYESDLIKKIFGCDNELDRFDILALEALKAPKYPAKKKTDEYRAASCDTKTWICPAEDYGDFYVESDSLFVKGLCVAMIEAIKNIPAGAEKTGFADECYERGIVTVRRRDGLRGIEEIILKYLNKSQGEQK